MYQFSLSWFK
jgi:hypothetical protein